METDEDNGPSSQTQGLLNADAAALENPNGDAAHAGEADKKTGAALSGQEQDSEDHQEEEEEEERQNLNFANNINSRPTEPLALGIQPFPSSEADELATNGQLSQTPNETETEKTECPTIVLNNNYNQEDLVSQFAVAMEESSATILANNLHQPCNKKSQRDVLTQAKPTPLQARDTPQQQLRPQRIPHSQRNVLRNSSPPRQRLNQQMPEQVNIDLLPRRTQSLKERAEQQLEHRRRHRQHQHQKTKLKIQKSTSDSTSRSTRGHNNQQQRGNRTDDDQSSDDETLLVVAKARAAMGDAFELQNPDENNNNTDINDNEKQQASKMDSSSMTSINNSNNDQSIDDKRRGRRPDDAHELKRPGAYSKSPGEEFRRNSTFQRDTFSRGNLQYNHSEDDSSSDTNNDNRHLGDRDTTNHNSHRDGNNFHSRVATKSSSDGGDESEEDRKPAALPRGTRRGRKRHTRIPRSERLRYRSQSRSEDDSDDDDEEEKEEIDGKFTPKGKMARTENTELDESGCDVAKAVAGFQRVGTASTNRSSLKLAGLKSCRTNSFHSSLNSSSVSWASTLSTGTEESNKMIADVAEQSVANFVRTYTNNIRRQRTVEATPIDAHVVPSEEELEDMMRSRLEEELRTHLTRELTSFREHLLREVIQRGNVQVADPIYPIVENDDTEAAGASATLEHVELSAGPYASVSISPSADTSESPERSEWRGEPENFVASPETPPASEHTEWLAGVEESNPPAASVLSRVPFGRKRKPAVLGDSFKKSIRQSIRMEFGDLASLADSIDLGEAVVEEAQVLASESPGDLEAPRPRVSTINERSSNANSQQGINCSEEAQARKRTSFFAMFLLGAFVGAGAAILAMFSLGD